MHSLTTRLLLTVLVAAALAVALGGAVSSDRAAATGFPPPTLPPGTDLVAFKLNNVVPDEGGASVLLGESWTWSVGVNNVGADPAVFPTLR